MKKDTHKKPGAPPDRVIGQLQDMLQGLLARKRVRHAILGLESGDRSFRWIGAAGEANPDGTPMLADTPFFIASVTKLLIAVSIFKLHERGLVDLDQPVGAYLPERLLHGLHRFKGIDYTDRITLRHLLSHTSGLPDWLQDRPSGGQSLLERIGAEEDRVIGVEDIVQFVREKLVPHFPPQSPQERRPRVRYSDTNFQLLIAVIEARLEESLHQAFEELLYRPLDLGRTFHPGHPPADLAIEPAVPWIGDTAFARPLLMQSFRDLYSTADDLLAFMRGIVEGTVFQDPATADLMQQKWNRFGLPRDLASLSLPGWPIDYGLGMMRLRMPRIFTSFKPVPEVIGHTGVTGSWLFHCPELDLYLCGTVD